ncbi:MAG: TonB-dependent receptor [Gammaproteobacteria bacterium]|nr:TonB-dependent receptor [Gammaproteobacteria bacterium]
MTSFAESRAALLAALAAALPVGVGAQEAAEGTLGEIIVTAQKREASLQEVPFSIAAQTEAQIRNSGATNIVEFARNVAGLTITDLGPGQSQVAIRGISAGQVVRDQPGVKEQVGIYLDESPISVALFTPDLDLYDLQRVEVLRGPQGTLFGAGSTSGTLRYITAAPRLGTFEGSTEVTASQGSGTDFGGALKAAVNLPIGESTALRLVGYYNELAGFIDAVQPSGSTNEDVDGGSKTGARVSLLLQPNDNFSILPRIVYQKLETDGYPRIDAFNILGNEFMTTEPAVNLGEREQYTQMREGLDDEFRMGDLKLEYAFPGVTLTAISTFTNRDVLVLRDATQLTGSVTFDLGGTDAEVRITSPLFDRTSLEAFSQEVRLSAATGSFQWVAGAFYQDVERKYGQTLPTPGYDAITNRLIGADSGDTLAPPDTPFYSRLSYDFQQLALFGEGTYQFNDQWALTAGLRYYDFEEDRILNFGGIFAVPQANVPGAVSSDGFSPRVIVTYSANDDVTLNAQVARGFRLGGINDPLNGPICTPADAALYGSVFSETWDDETALTYELGAKTRLAEGRVVFNTAIFFSDIKDLQANVDAGSCSSRIVVNVPEAHSLGAEVELFARPNENWDFGISASWVEAEIDSNVTGAGTTPIRRHSRGNRLPTAPEFQAAASVSYSMPIMQTREFFSTFTVQHVGSSYTQLADQEAGFGFIGGPPGSARIIGFGDPNFTSLAFDAELPSYEIGNLRLGVRDDRWEVAGFINNVWDERAFLSVDRERGRSARVGYLTNRPRTYGVTLRVNF